MPAPSGPSRRSGSPTRRGSRAHCGRRGCGTFSVEPVTWEIVFDSLDDFLDVGMNGNPIPRQLSAALTQEQFTQVRHILDGMLRERSGGETGAVLHAHMQIGRGTV